MADFSWNREQEIAINSKAKTMLVAAAAGSGKTAVMVQRIIELIKSGKPIDKMLIVTFTNASTADMKEKIRKAVKKEIFDSEDAKKRELFRTQLDAINRANISNFHGFAMNVIKQFFYKLPDLEPGFRVEEELRLKLIKNQVMDNLMYEYFNGTDEEHRKFIAFLDSYTDGRRFARFKEQVLALHESIRNIPNYMVEIPDMIEKMKGIKTGEDFLNYNDNRNRYVKIVESMVDKLLEDYYRARKDAENADHKLLSEKVIIPLRIAPAEKIKAAVNLGEFASALDLVREISSIRYSIPSSKESNISKEEKVSLRQAKDDFDKNFLSAKSLKGKHSLIGDIEKNLGILTNDGDYLDGEVRYYRKTLDNAEFMLNFTLEFDRRYSKAKKDAGVIDFSDIEHFAIEILKDQVACDFYRKKFGYIFVDEYQDTSALQEYVIQRIASDSQLFMVGDIKQSIYSFRKAEPSIFLSKYEGFVHERDLKINNSENRGEVEGNSGTGYAEESREELEPTGIDETDQEVVVDLSANYRSKIEILEEVNNLFSDTMEGYDENSSLKHGAPNPTDLRYKPVYYFVDDENESFDGRDRAELEAIAIAKIIKEHLGKEYYDSKEAAVKKIGYGDIVILSKAVKNHGTKMARKLEELGIPVYVTKKGDFFDAIEVRIFFNLLQVINNRLLDLPLLSVLHSELFGFTEAELAEIALSKEQYFYLKMMEYVDKGRDQILKNKITAFDDLIKAFSEFSMENNLDVLLWKVMQETGYFLMVGAMPMGEMRQANLQYLVELALDYENNGNTGLSGFLESLNKIKTDETLMMEEADTVGEGRNAVRIMTIHQSKGLEFPMVILARYNNRLKGNNTDNTWAFNKDIGLGLPGKEGLFSQGKKTILQELIEDTKKKGDMEEYLRLLYVALTRATDILNVVGVRQASTSESFATLAEWKGCVEKISVSELDEFVEHYYGLKGDEVEVIAQQSANDEIGCNSVEKIGDAAELLSEAGEVSSSNETIQIVNGDAKKSVYERLNYRYPFEAAALISPKYTATEVNKMMTYAEEDEGVQVPELAGVGSSKAADKSGMGRNHGLPDVPSKEPGAKTPARPLARPSFLAAKEAPGAARRGSLYHKFLELASYPDGAAAGSAYLDKLAEEMLAKGIITKEEMKTVDLALISDFFKTDLAHRMAKADEKGLLFKEHKFIYATSSEDEIFEGLGDRIRKGAEKESLILQGIMDAFFIEEDEKGEKYFVLVDFKTNRVDTDKIDSEIERIKNTYEKQMITYSKALESSYLLTKDEYMPVREKVIYLIGAKICIDF